MIRKKTPPGAGAAGPAASDGTSEDDRDGSPLAAGSHVRAVPAVAQRPAAAEPAPRHAVGGWISRDPIVVGRPVPRFEPKEVAGNYRRAPYRPDTILDGWSAGSFTVRGGTVRGYMNRHDGVPRQDDFAVTARNQGQQIIAAVADGVSQAAQSHIGATAAVRYACQWLDSMLASPVDDTDWKALIESTAWALVEQARSIDPDCTDAAMAERLVATTLVCAVIETRAGAEAVAHIINVGDSGAWLLTSTGYTKVDGGKTVSDDGLSSSAVSGLPRIPRHTQATQVILPEGGVLLLGTDGFGDPLGLGDGPVGDLFAGILLPGPPSLTEFGHALDFSRETFDDDRTLLAIWHHTDENTTQPDPGHSTAATPHNSSSTRDMDPPHRPEPTAAYGHQ